MKLKYEVLVNSKKKITATIKVPVQQHSMIKKLGGGFFTRGIYLIINKAEKDILVALEAAELEDQKACKGSKDNKKKAA